MKEFPYTEIEERIGYQFTNKQLLKQAFTHSTYANTYGGEDNERMEYLGDAVLQMVVTEWQYEQPAKSEGVMTRERQKLVCEEALDEAVRRLGVQRQLLIVGGKANVGRKTVSSLFETLTAAIYLDGGYQEAKAFIFQHGGLAAQEAENNWKGALQEYLQKRGENIPEYHSKKTGKDNAPIFRCQATALGKRTYGEGASKRLAEQQAAKALLEAIQEEYPSS